VPIARTHKVNVRGKCLDRRELKLECCPTCVRNGRGMLRRRLLDELIDPFHGCKHKKGGSANGTKSPSPFVVRVTSPRNSHYPVPASHKHRSRIAFRYSDSFHAHISRFHICELLWNSGSKRNDHESRENNDIATLVCRMSILHRLHVCAENGRQ
jgi:hypothetical protein